MRAGGCVDLIQADRIQVRISWLAGYSLGERISISVPSDNVLYHSNSIYATTSGGESRD